MEDYSLIGLALISCQRVEFLTLGIVSHSKSIKSDNQFKNLTPEVFLDNSPDGRRFRKQTLGQIFRVLKQEKSLAISDKLDEYLENRNVLIHELWRKFLKGQDLTQPNLDLEEFCKELIDKSAKIERFYKGFFWTMALGISTRNGVEIPSEIKKFQDHNYFFLECLENRNFI